jgi:hypothetical protein
MEVSRDTLRPSSFPSHFAEQPQHAEAATVELELWRARKAT